MSTKLSKSQSFSVASAAVILPFARRAGAFAVSALTITAMVAGSGGGAAPASAATVPVGESILIIDRDGVLSQAFPDTGELIPTSDTGIKWITGLDVDTAGRGYAVNQDRAGANLYEVNLVGGGTLSNPIPITTDIGENVTDCRSLDYDASGTVVLSCNEGRSVGMVDPSTGNFFSAITMPHKLEVASLASDPISGVLYGFTYEQDVVVLDLKAGTYAVVGNTAPFYLEHGADFDSAGVLWAVGFDPHDRSSKWPEDDVVSVQTSDWAVTVEAKLPSHPDKFYFESAFTIWRQDTATESR